jgi:signal transduction histidine kinase
VSPRADESAHPAMIDFPSVFASLPGAMVVLSPELKVLAVTDELRSIAMMDSDAMIGRDLFELFPDDPDAPMGANTLKRSLKQVVDTRRPDVMPLTKYGLKRPEAEGGGYVDKYWQASNHPVLGPDGRLLYIIHRTEDVTAKHEAELALEAATRQLQAQSEALAERTAFLENLIEHVPAGIAYLDKHLYWRIINPIFERISQAPARQEFIGRYVFDTLPGTEDQIEGLLRGVLETGTPYQATDFKYVYVREGQEVVTYWDFIYHPIILDPEQGVEGILVLAHDTSKRVEQEHEREQHARALEREKGRVEAEVAQRTQELKRAYETVAAQAEAIAGQKAFVERILDTMPAGVAYLDRELVYRFANPLYARFIDKAPDQVVGRYLDDVLPGAVAQVGPWLREVIETSRPFENAHFRLDTPDPAGNITHTYWDFVYYPDEPDEDGRAKGVFVLANEISERLRTQRDHDEMQRERIEALEQTDRLKDQFLGILSHELRTPINAIMGFGSVLDDEVPGRLNADQRAYTGKILASADALLALIDDLLVISRVRAGKFAMMPERTNLTGPIAQAVEALGPAAAKKHLDLVVDMPDSLPMLEADPQRIRQVVANLLGNAIKFTPDGGTVTLRMRREREHLYGEVVDTGVGIAPENCAKLFKPFSQLDMSNTRQASGTGLGLSIVKAIVEAHGGSVGVQSEPGQGSTFWFTIPLGHDAGPGSRDR